MALLPSVRWLKSRVNIAVNIYSVAINLHADLRPKIGGQLGTDWWSIYSETQVREHGLWCQVLSSQNPEMIADIGEWYYPPGDTPDASLKSPVATVVHPTSH